MKLKNTQKAAMNELGIDKLRSHQKAPIDSILDGSDTFTIFPTSAGKSAVFQIPGIILHNEDKKKWTLVIEPTIALMYDQVQKLKALGLKAEYMAHDNKEEHDNIRGQVQKGKYTLLYVTPERLQDPRFMAAISETPPALVVVDEAHCVTEWGTLAFRVAYNQIGERIKHLRPRPVIAAFTATAPEEYRKDICRSLQMKKPNFFTMSLARENLTVIQKDYSDWKLNKRLKEVTKTVDKYIGDGSVVIYCTTKASVDVLYNHLSQKSEYKGQVTRYHSHMKKKDQESSELRFLKGKRKIMIATSAFGMGVDKGDIRLVLHDNMPFSIVDYYQQIGRAGRDGEKAYAVLFYDEADIKANQKILGGKKLAKDRKEVWETLTARTKSEMKLQIEQETQESLERFDDLVDILQSDQCIMEQVLTYLGDENTKKCGRCSNCQRNRKIGR